MTTRNIPFSAYLDLQAEFAYKSAFCDNFDALSFQVGQLDERQFFALASCLLPFNVSAEAFGSHPSTVETRTQLLIDLLAKPMKYQRQLTEPNRAISPTDPRNYVDWERLCEYARKSKAIRGVVSTLLDADLFEFVQSYPKDRTALRDSTTTHLERQHSPNAPHILCPQQQAWLHEAVFHGQFCISAIGIDRAVSESSINGLLTVCLDQIADWLKKQEGEIALSLTQFGVLLARGEFQDQRIQWRYQVKPDTAYPFRIVSSADFLNLAQESSKRAEFNLRKNLYLGHDLGL